MALNKNIVSKYIDIIDEDIRKQLTISLDSLKTMVIINKSGVFKESNKTTKISIGLDENFNDFELNKISIAIGEDSYLFLEDSKTIIVLVESDKSFKYSGEV